MRVIAAVTGVAVIAALSLGGPLRRLELVFFVALPLGLALAEMGRDQWMTPIRLRRTVCTKIRETPEGVAAIRGRIVPGECGLVISPVTGRAAVWVGLDFMEHHFGRGGPSEWVIRREAAGNDFLIDDGSGNWRTLR
ncbi:MAG TPA: hypothetical protein VHO06_25140 [Polyangia bacterium]|nr:hypothetical protein [Polyangia bacterium]